MTEVEPNLKPLHTCPCTHPDCPREGTPRRKAWVDGTHVRRCPCRRCVGSRQRAKATRRENKVAKALRGDRQPLSGALNGADVVSRLVDVEETANEALVRGIRRWWLSGQIQTKLARLLARRIRARAFVVSWDGRPQLAVLTFADLVELCETIEGDGGE